ncbi:conserved protein, unknown function [Babesia microti strain RI]|uniref:Uncharacterized protein n=1 Tax=Babesia microti (strain RI) TaxID=1133968 RepID=A0A1N6LXM3_BABMR|nr:conserved protein, unknown function [Babesia microti strain RI]SIO73625.1 conserved protein, unknown function [Babesia microti strain RI]|eukprot:XP_012649830.2 conserved protein, unknown function [Babesia microti strain RI]
MNLDVLSITTLSILLFLPYNYQCIEELNPDGLDPDEFDFSYDKKTYERHKKTLEHTNRMKEIYRLNSKPQLPPEFFKRISLYSLALILLSIWAYKGYKANYQIANEWFDALTPLFMICIPMTKNEKVCIKSLGYHHLELSSPGIKHFVFLLAELKLKMRQCFWIHNARKLIFPEYDIFNLTIVYSKMDLFAFTIVNNLILNEFLNDHPEVRRAAVRHDTGDVTQGLFTFTNSISAFDNYFTATMKANLQELAPYVRYIHSSDIIAADDTANCEENAVPSDTYKGIKMSFKLPPKDQYTKLITLMTNLIELSYSITLNERVKCQINEARSEYISELAKANDERLKKEMADKNDNEKKRRNEKTLGLSSEEHARITETDDRVKSKQRVNRPRFKVVR